MINVSPFQLILHSLLMVASAVSHSSGQEAVEGDPATAPTRQEEAAPVPTDKSGGGEQPRAYSAQP
jgi:hypothetical protein